MNSFLLTDRAYWFFLAVAGLAAIFLLGIVDHITGPQLSFSIFYLLPISLVAWFAGRGSAVFLCFAGAITWWVVETRSHVPYAHPLTPYWNAFVRLSFFLAIVFLELRVKTLHGRLVEKMRETTTGLSVETTERQRAEEELRSTSEMLHALIQASPLAILALDTEGKVRMWNPAAERMFGWAKEEVVGRPLPYVPEEKQEEYLALRKRVLSGEGFSNVEVRRRKKDGSLIDICLFTAPLRDGEGCVNGIMGIIADITERKQAEAALRASEERYRDLVENTQELIGTHDWEGRILSVNQGAAKLLGYDSSALEKMNVRDFLASEVRDQFDSYLATLRKDGCAKGTMVVQTAAGERRIWKYNNTLRTEGVATPIVRAMAYDITERIRAEEEIRQSHQKYEELVNSVDGIVWEADARTFQFSFVSKHAQRILGYPTEQWITEPTFWKDHIHPEDREWAVSFCVDATVEKKSHQFEYRMIAADGRVVWFRDNVVVVLKDGQPEVLRGIMMDITERRQAEAALRQAEEKYRSIFENSTEGIFQTTPEGRFLTANPALARILGYRNPVELIASVTDIGHQFYVEPERRLEMKRLLEEQGVVQRLEVQVYRRDGNKIWVSENARAIRDAQGVVLYYEGTLEDITERKHLQEQLLQAQKMEAIGQLAGGVAHDFNNLLTAILGYSQLILNRVNSGDTLYRNADEIKKAAERGAALTRQLLAFSRRQMLELKVLDLNEVVANIDKLIRRLIGEDIELIIRLRPNLGSMKADRGQIEQVIMNLVVNARDAMPHGGKLTIETENVEIKEEYTTPHFEAHPAHYVSLAVIDTGVGMSAEVQSHLFEPFFTTKEKGKGTGLGLATVYGIVKQSGGHIWVCSETGQGTTFVVYFPLVSEKTLTVGTEDRNAGLPRGSETVLLVEDESIVRELSREILMIYGYHVLEAANGSEALLIGEQYQGPIQLMVTDVVMPHMSGTELASRLAPLRPDTIVLYLSGYTDDAIFNHCVLDPGIAFLQKPFTPESLARKVREVLDKGQ